MRALAVVSLCLLSCFTLVGCGDEDEDTFRATLTGTNEVPPNSSTATGTATVMIRDDANDPVDFRLEVQGMVDVTGAHIHSGAAGTNGPVRVTLLATPRMGAVSGVLAEGSFTAADVSGIGMADLLNEIRSGNAYVNVHTVLRPGGEIRAQLVAD